MYLLYLDFENKEKRYVKIHEDKIDILLNPYHATEFKNIADGTKWIIDNTNSLWKYSKEIKKQKAIDEFNEWCKTGMKIQERGIVKKQIPPTYSNQTPEEILEIMVDLGKYDEETINHDAKNNYPRTSETFKFIHKINSYSRYNDQDVLKHIVGFEIAVPKNNKDYCTFKKEIDLILGYNNVKKDDYHQIEIFDYRLCEFGNKDDLFIKNDKDCYVGGRFSERIKSSLEKCFEHISTQLWYGD